MNNCKKEKAILYNWAVEHESEKYTNTVFSKINKSEKSYFCERLEADNYMEFMDYDTLEHLEKRLSLLFEGDKVKQIIILPICLASLKEREEGISQSDIIKPTKDKDVLPSYIYNF